MSTTIMANRANIKKVPPMPTVFLLSLLAIAPLSKASSTV